MLGKLELSLGTVGTTLKSYWTENQHNASRCTFSAVISFRRRVRGKRDPWRHPARFHLNLRKGLFATLKGDAGGFGVGSQLTYQIDTGIGKEFKQKFSTIIG
jgi:hypothetical protein